MTPNGSPAERAGRAAKTARRQKRDRERVRGLAAFVLIAVPLLFAAAWTRTEVTRELRFRDGLLADRDSLEGSVLRLSSTRSRLSGWQEIDERLSGTGLRPPRGSEVVWVRVPREGE